MTYLYTGPGSFYTLLGSCVRALGKGWIVGVVSKQKHMRTFTDMRGLLKDPEKLIVARRDPSTTLRFARDDRKKSDLLLFDGATSFVSKEHHVMVARERSRGGFRASRNDTRIYDLISIFSHRQLRQHGVTALTGTGKGKTTSAIGMAMEEVIAGKKVAIIQWFKERQGKSGTFPMSEHAFSEKLNDPSVIEFHPTGLGFFGSPNLDRVKGGKAYIQHRKRAYAGMELARKKILSRDYAVVVLDEFVDTTSAVAKNLPMDLIDLSDVQQFLQFCQHQHQTNIIVTGRRVTNDWRQFIKDSTVITNIKHPWTSGKSAISGLDF